MSLGPNDDMHRRRPIRSEPLRSDDGILSDGSIDGEAHGIVDFNQAALYMPGLQVLCALLGCCLASILTAVASAAVGTVSAVRTATAAVLVGIAIIWRPIRVSSYVLGVDVMFDALRPCIFVYVGALILEQLVHSCGAPPAAATSGLRYGFFQALVLAMAAAGFVQAHRPRRQTDYPFVVVASALLFIAFFTPPTRMTGTGDGPLCEPPTTGRAVERIFRALLFGTTYCALAYASEPARHTVEEVGLCAMRAIVGTVWILCIHRYLLFVAAIQTFVVLWARMRDEKQRHSPVFAPLRTDDAHHRREEASVFPAPAHEYGEPEAYLVDDYGHVRFEEPHDVNGGLKAAMNPPAEPSRAVMARVAAQIINGNDAV